MKNTFSETQTITSRDKIKEVFDEFFPGRTAYIKLPQKDIRVKCYSCSNGKVMIGIPFIKSLPEPAIVYTARGNKIVHLYLRKIERAGIDITIFDVIKCNLIVPARDSCRHHIYHGGDHKKVVYVTGFVSETIIDNSLLYQGKKISSVFGQAEIELAKHFSSVKFITKIEAHDDSRMQYIAKSGSGIVIREVDEKIYKDNQMAEHYINSIINSGKFPKNGKLPVSEALYPLFYKNKMPYGYLQLNKDSSMTDTDLKLAEKFVKSIEQYLLKNEVFPAVMDKIIVKEISSAGLSILHSGRKNLRHFKVGNPLCFDLVLPGSIRINLLAAIRHNSSDTGGILRTGMEILKVDSSHHDIFNGYIASFNQKE